METDMRIGLDTGMEIGTEPDMPTGQDIDRKADIEADIEPDKLIDWNMGRAIGMLTDWATNTEPMTDILTYVILHMVAAILADQKAGMLIDSRIDMLTRLEIYWNMDAGRLAAYSFDQVCHSLNHTCFSGEVNQELSAHEFRLCFQKYVLLQHTLQTNADESLYSLCGPRTRQPLND